MFKLIHKTDTKAAYESHNETILIGRSDPLPGNQIIALTIKTLRSPPNADGGIASIGRKNALISHFFI